MMMNKRKLWIGTISAAVLLSGTAVAAASSGIGGQSAQQASKPTSQVTTQTGTETLLTAAQAKAAALKAVEGKVDDVDLERRNGQTFYEVEIDRKGNDAVVRLDAYTGKIVAVLNDDDDDNDDDYTTGTVAAGSKEVKLTAAQASSIALKQVGGGKVTKVELDHDDGRYVYEVELRTDQGEADVDVDADTGKVLKFDQDFDDED
ncbi:MULTISPECIES: PepSY domain-containing protein [Paenibacillus]|uniref:PepSY domain-containing protein n=1 Tax=Paenibacillus TaxID=44249 RepID=UPI001F3BDBC8|nr:PepSY domain-containing protein [Paenibacillus sp. JJ-223]CAH1196691.1 putative protein YkoJ [Paenibacillus sp. JJ-223]